MASTVWDWTYDAMMLPDLDSSAADCVTPNVFGSDRAVVELLRRRKSLTINELTTELNVTANAVRQRLSRLISQGYVVRETIAAQRGRPSHAYALTAKALRQGGDNFADLSMILWQELRSIENVEVRNALLKRLANRLVAVYSPKVTGKTVVERMDAVARLFTERNVPFECESHGDRPLQASQNADSNLKLPIVSNDDQSATLIAWACPYPELAEQDRAICAVEKSVLTQLLGAKVKLESCRLDGEPCCRFQTT